jgi:hypothetical protein
MLRQAPSRRATFQQGEERHNRTDMGWRVSGKQQLTLTVQQTPYDRVATRLPGAWARVDSVATAAVPVILMVCARWFAHAQRPGAFRLL